MSMKRLQSGICWALLAFMIFFAFWAIGSLYASATNSSAEDKNAQEKRDGPNIKIDANLVTTDVTVIGKPASELKADDFVLYDNGFAQPVTFFSQDQIPIAIALLLDGSENIRPFLPVIQLAGLSALRHLRVDDQVALYSFCSTVKRDVNLTDDRVLVADAISEIKIDLGSAIYDAIVDATEYLIQTAPKSRRVIILISNNNRMMGVYTADQAMYSLRETSTTLYNIRAQSGGDAVTRDWTESDKAITTMVAETGGEFLDVRVPIVVQEALKNAIFNIRKQFTLGFVPSNPGKAGTLHKLEVKLDSPKRCPGCVINTRKSYFTGAVAPGILPPIINKPVRTLEETDELVTRRIITYIATADFDMTDIPFVIQYHEITDDKKMPAIKIDLQIPIQNIAFKIEEGRPAYKLRLGIFAAVPGKVLGTEWKVIEGRLSEETIKKGAQARIPVSITIPRAREMHQLKTVVYDDGSDHMGSVTTVIAASRAKS
jgi:Ca-activated chloride channel homolog